MPDFFVTSPIDDGEIEFMSCTAAQWGYFVRSGSIWSFETLALVAAYILGPALLIILAAGYWHASTKAIKSYIHWINHGSRDKHSSVSKIDNN